MVKSGVLMVGAGLSVDVYELLPAQEVKKLAGIMEGLQSRGHSKNVMFTFISVGLRMLLQSTTDAELERVFMEADRKYNEQRKKDI